MIKKTLLSALMACGLLPALAQSAYEPTAPSSESMDVKKLRFGVYVAPNLSWMRPTTAKDGDQTQKNDGSKVGFTYGILADYNFADNYAIATGLQVTSTGGKISTEDKSSAPAMGTVLKSNFNYTLQYLEIPIALKLRTDDINKFRFFGQAGMTIGFNISKKATWEILQENGATDNTIKTDSKEKITGGVGCIAPVLFQMSIGAGAEYSLSDKLDGYVGIFFNNGFAPDATRPDKFNKTPGFKDGNTRLNNFALRLGFYF